MPVLLLAGIAGLMGLAAGREGRPDTSALIEAAARRFVADVPDGRREACAARPADAASGKLFVACAVGDPERERIYLVSTEGRIRPLVEAR